MIARTSLVLKLKKGELKFGEGRILSLIDFEVCRRNKNKLNERLGKESYIN